MTPAENERLIAARLEPLPDPFERLNTLVASAGRLPPLDPGERIDAFKVPGCLATVWIVPERTDERTWRFRSQSDAPMVGALAAVVCEIFSGCPASAIRGHRPTVFDALGLIGHLTENRRRGLARMIDHIHRLVALAEREAAK